MNVDFEEKDLLPREYYSGDLFLIEFPEFFFISPLAKKEKVYFRIEKKGNKNRNLGLIADRCAKVTETRITLKFSEIPERFGRNIP